MIRHSLIRQTVLVLAAYLLCIPLQGNSQPNRIMQQKTAALLGKYLVSFKSERGTLRYVLHIDSARGMFFFGSLENDTNYHPSRREVCRIKGLLAERKGYDFIMKPDLEYGTPYKLICQPHEWLLNNKTYFSIREPNIINGYMLATNDMDNRMYSFSGMKQEPEKEPEKVLVSLSTKP
ncbi:hypothetical protein AAHN97_16670 [Chitinophaga niabensis]|uniref:hypothetical protein n=1 Tax=Chitinophaga niabensis TaxID=536979 RepID=UPI0031B9AE95